MFGKDTIGEKQLSLSKLLIPDSAPVGSYLTVVAKGTLGFTSVTLQQILNLLTDGSIPLSKVSTAPGLATQILSLDADKKWIFIEKWPDATGTQDGRILYTPSSTDPADDKKILAVKPNTTGYTIYDINELLPPGLQNINRWVYHGDWNIVAPPDGVIPPDGPYNPDTLFATANTNRLPCYKWKHDLAVVPKLIHCRARAHRPSEPHDGGEPPEGDGNDPQHPNDSNALKRGYIEGWSCDINEVMLGFETGAGSPIFIAGPAYNVFADKDYVYVRARPGGMPMCPFEPPGLDTQTSAVWYLDFVFDLLLES